MPESQAGIAGVYQIDVPLQLGAYNTLLWKYEENRAKGIDFFPRLSPKSLLALAGI